MIGFLYKNILKPYLFLNDPETVHDNFTRIGEILGKFSITKKVTKAFFHYENPKLEQKILGIHFNNPVGLSAGFDKDGRLVNILGDVGFGFTQVGSVTFNPYEGNPKPRLYRLPKSKGLVVYYGLKNEGIKIINERLKKLNVNIPYSYSVAKTNCKETSTLEAGVEDYYNTLKFLNNNDSASFYTINISCPNTFGGEPFTTAESLEKLLVRIDSLKIDKPIFIKMPISLPWEDNKKLVDVILKHNIQGIIIGNLNKNRGDPAIKDKIPEKIKGGISGLPTKKLSNELIAKTYKYTEGRLIIIGVGGVFSAEDAYEKIKLGASLVQLITGMIFEGPQLIGEINRGLVKLLEKDGFSNISEAVGTRLNEK